MSFSRAWKICSWCTRQGFRLSLWTTWLLLLAVIAVQVYLISSRRIPIPDPLRRAVEQRLAGQGVHLEFGRGRMNLTGRFILENVRLSPAGTRAPLATARSVYLKIDAQDLFLGKFNLGEVRVSGLDLHLPPSRSLSGVDEVPAGNIDFTLRSAEREIELSHFSGYIGRIPVQASGRLPLPASPAAGARPEARMERIIAACLDLAGQVQAAGAWLDTLESPRLDLRLTPTAIAVDFRAGSVDLGAIPNAPGGKLDGVRLHTTLPLDGPLTSPLEVTGTVASLNLPHEISARDLIVRFRGAPAAGGLDVRSLELQLASLQWREIAAGPLTATATRSNEGLVTTDVAVFLAGSPWRLQGAVEPDTGVAHVELDGFVGDATLAFAGSRINRDLTGLLDPADPAPLHAAASFGPGWKLTEASGRLHSGPVRVGGAQLDETGTEFTYDGTRVLCDHLVLRQGESLAHGSYEMDTRTMDFRYLLTGGLHPEGIESWFHGWWSEFWSTFDFSRGLPSADVDVRGRWGDLTATRVFVQAAAAGTGLKDVSFDRVRTRLFLRPHWFDILHFNVVQGNQEAQGVLARSLDLEKAAWRHMEFSVDSSLPLETISRLFKEESSELLKPYRFTTPPRLHLSGRVDSAVSPAGKREQIDITLTSTGPMTYHDFPLSDLTFEANLRDDRLDLPTLAVGFAEGQANGTARLWGAEGSRRLAFNITLADANLGAVTQAVSRLQPTSAPPTEKTAGAARLRQQRLDRGRLVFALAAEGLFTDFYSFKGTGRAAITGAELAQLNLFGPLSEALRSTYFSFGSFSLTTLNAPFVLDGHRLRFEDVRVTGPSALLQARGEYHLRDGRLDFVTKVHPFDESGSLVGNAVGFVLSPLSKVFEVKLQGTLSKPSWIFAYGPSRLLNTITGGDENPSSEPAPAPTEPARAPFEAPVASP
ncbi:MAG: hypothetical protein K0R17_2222 [Rariglobus sp.]|jgi:hypothetical protein|nr:hypothetical protein [Rariglobus sp.]